MIRPGYRVYVQKYPTNKFRLSDWFAKSTTTSTMATREKLEEKNVAELKELAGKKDIPGRWTMSKDELIDALLENGDDSHAHAKTEEHKGKAGEPDPDYPPQYPIAGMTIKGEGKANARLFQTSPDVKEYLTQDEAKAKGFYWKETDEEKEAKGKAKKG